MRRFHILQIGAFPFPSHQGSQVHAAGQCRALARRGHTVWLAAYAHGQGVWPDGVRRVAVPGLPGGTLASGPHPSKVLLDAVLVGAVARLLTQETIDVIVAHNVEAPFVAWAARRLSGRRPPVVYDMHTSLEEELPVYLRGERVREGAARLGHAVDRWIARRADATVAISRRGADALASWGARAVHRVPPGVDPDETAGGDPAAARARWSLGDGPWVVYTGNLDPYQDLDVLVRAMARVPEAGLLVVTGADPVAWASGARAAGLPDARLRVVRSTDLRDVADALAAGALAALPRRVCAGFPIKLLNYLAAGRPAVCAEGSAQPIEGVVTVQGGDDRAMAEAIRGLLRSPSMCRRLGEAGARAVRARWSWDRRAAELEAVYASVVEGG